jgi:hypothetical protein
MVKDVQAWRYLCGYRLFANDPPLRHEALARLAAAAGRHTTRAPFPSRIDPPPLTRMLDYGKLDALLDSSVRGAEKDLSEVDALSPTVRLKLGVRRLTAGQVMSDQQSLGERAAERWLDLYAHLTHQLDDPPGGHEVIDVAHVTTHA